MEAGSQASLPTSKGFYGPAAVRMLFAPAAFFADWRDREATFRQPAVFLLVSSLFFAAAGLLAGGCLDRPMLFAVLLVNAVGMTGLAAVLGYILVLLLPGKDISGKRLFGVYAFSSGITLWFSWVPFSFWLTEPWKWWLIYTGLTGACGLRPGRALLVLGLSLTILFLLFGSLLAALQTG